jgi:hypothetical protein
MKTHTTSGVQVTEYDLDVDTEDITIEPLEAAADQWELLADVYSKGEACPGCMWHESGWNAYTNTRWRECSAFAPSACPAINPRSIANALRRQAS